MDPITIPNETSLVIQNQLEQPIITIAVDDTGIGTVTLAVGCSLNGLGDLGSAQIGTDQLALRGAVNGPVWIVSKDDGPGCYYKFPSTPPSVGQVLSVASISGSSGNDVTLEWVNP